MEVVAFASVRYKYNFERRGGQWESSEHIHKLLVFFQFCTKNYLSLRSDWLNSKNELILPFYHNFLSILYS